MRIIGYLIRFFEPDIERLYVACSGIEILLHEISPWIGVDLTSQKIKACK